MSRNKI